MTTSLERAILPTVDERNDVALSVAVPKRVATIANVRIDTLDFVSTVSAILTRTAETAGNVFVVTPNAHHVVVLQTDERLRRAYDDAFLVVPDGVPLLWASSLLHQGLSERVNGTDLFEALCARAAPLGLRVFFLGGRAGAADAAASSLKIRYPGLEICGTYCPNVGFESDAVECELIVARINAVKPHLLFVGLGAPKQELWMHANRSKIDARVSLGIGVSFEFIGGIVPRAPRWMQVSGLEWFFRLCSEPRRLWRRYIVGNTMFCALVLRQWLSQKPLVDRATVAIDLPTHMAG